MRKMLVIAVLLVAGCREDVAQSAPNPVAMTDESLGHYCQMVIADHDGPKAQIHLEGMPQPIFFAQVRDGVAYLLEPEKTAAINAFYVSNMSQAISWAEPGPENWIAADAAYFVVGGDARGGMGNPEIVPFASEVDAEIFAATHGGEIMRLNDIPSHAVLGAVDHEIGEGS